MNTKSFINDSLDSSFYIIQRFWYVGTVIPNTQPSEGQEKRMDADWLRERASPNVTTDLVKFDTGNLRLVSLYLVIFVF